MKDNEQDKIPVSVAGLVHACLDVGDEGVHNVSMLLGKLEDLGCRHNAWLPMRPRQVKQLLKYPLTLVLRGCHYYHKYS